MEIGKALYCSFPIWKLKGEKGDRVMSEKLLEQNSSKYKKLPGKSIFQLQ